MECSTRNFHLQSPNLGIALRQISTMSFFLFHLILVPSVTPVSFTFDSFNLSNPNMEYEGDAFQSNGVIQLTKDQAYRNLNNCSGRAIYGDPVRIWDRATLGLADFTTHFSFSIDTLDRSVHGDGLAFFLAANKSLPSNSAGSCLGLVNCNNGLNTSHDPYVAVEFDTFPNTWDPNYDHIGINLNSLESVPTVSWRFRSNARNRATVTYNSSTFNFSVRLTYDDSPSDYSSASRLVDLRDYLPEWVTIGFSASTGSVFQIHSVLDWDFQSNLETVDQSQQNGTVAEGRGNGTVAENGRNRTVAVIPRNETGAGSQRNETVAVRVPRKKKNMGVVLVPCVVVILLAGFGLIWFLWRKKRSGSNEGYNGPTSDELEQTKNQEDSALINNGQIIRKEQAHHGMASSIVVHGTIHETNGGMPVAIEDPGPTPQNTIEASNGTEQEQYAGTREMASSSAINEMQPTPQSTMVPPASGTRGNTFPKEFSYVELANATNSFTERVIGKGGFGKVFKGSLGDQNLEVAIKKFSKGPHDRGVKQFESEVKTLSRLRHENLVQLYGWCNEKEELILVYEFMPNGSLWDRLFEEERLLAWKERCKIVQDLANGLLHLHEEGESYIIHRDIKSCNVLLDVDFKAKLGDFGLARLVEEGEDPLTTYIAGTRGYLAPECERRQKPSKQSDVYSFGIVVLEIGCGKKSFELVDNLELVQWVWMLYGNENILEAADPRLSKEFDENEMKCLLIVGLWCAHPEPTARPSIGEANEVLLQKAPPPSDLPQKMPCIYGRGPSNDRPPVEVDGASSHGKSFATAPSGHPNEN